MPAMHLIRVDLPAPLSPTSAVTSPARASNATPRSTCTAPKLLPPLRTSRIAGPVGTSCTACSTVWVILELPDQGCCGRAAWWPPDRSGIWQVNVILEPRRYFTPALVQAAARSAVQIAAAVV